MVAFLIKASVIASSGVWGEGRSSSSVGMYFALYLLINPLFHSLKGRAWMVFVSESVDAAPIEIILPKSGVILVTKPKSFTKLEFPD